MSAGEGEKSWMGLKKNPHQPNLSARPGASAELGYFGTHGHCGGSAGAGRCGSETPAAPARRFPARPKGTARRRDLGRVKGFFFFSNI